MICADFISIAELTPTFLTLPTQTIAEFAALGAVKVKAPLAPK
jgi:hypothetical protein